MNTDELKVLCERFEQWLIDSQDGRKTEHLADITEDLSDALRELLAERERMIRIIRGLVSDISQGVDPASPKAGTPYWKDARELLKEIEGK